MSSFPLTRMRRMRRTSQLRALVAETQLVVQDLVAPLFVREGLESLVEIPSLPGVFQHGISSLLEEIQYLVSLGVNAVTLFGIPAEKDGQGSCAWEQDGVIQVATKAIKDNFGDQVVVITDLCLDEYISHGHCGILDNHGQVDNDATLEVYKKIAQTQAQAGSDIIAPSGMMDGQVLAIRKGLDEVGFSNLPILAYSAKYASSLYGPFRDAVNVEVQGGGDRKGYQQDYKNSKEAMIEIELDIQEGADMVMVKPALAYLDIISKASHRFDVPVAAYHVSGEYAMIKAAAERGWIDGLAVTLEHLGAIKRAGASFILTYSASEVAEALGE